MHTPEEKFNQIIDCIKKMRKIEIKGRSYIITNVFDITTESNGVISYMINAEEVWEQ